MKKIALVTLVILALLVSMLPMSTAMAAKKDPGTTAVFIKNQTGAPITLVLTTGIGSQRQQITLPTGSYYITVPVANYTYVAATACANRSGSLNLTRRAQLYFSCKSAGEQIVFARIVPR